MLGSSDVLARAVQGDVPRDDPFQTRLGRRRIVAGDCATRSRIRRGAGSQRVGSRSLHGPFAPDHVGASSRVRPAPRRRRAFALRQSSSCSGERDRTPSARCGAQRARCLGAWGQRAREGADPFALLPPCSEYLQPYGCRLVKGRGRGQEFLSRVTRSPRVEDQSSDRPEISDISRVSKPIRGSFVDNEIIGANDVRRHSAQVNPEALVPTVSEDNSRWLSRKSSRLGGYPSWMTLPGLRTSSSDRPNDPNPNPSRTRTTRLAF